jgi:hypothetical protein
MTEDGVQKLEAAVDAAVAELGLIIRACLKSLRRQSSIATDRFRIQHRPSRLGRGNWSLCP